MFILGGGLKERFDEETLRSSLKGVDLIVALQTHRSVVTELATIAVPMVSYAETDGTICNFEGQVQRYWAAIPPLGESRSLLEILADLAGRWEVQSAPRDAEECFGDLAGEIAYFNSMSYDALGEAGLNPSKQEAVAAS